MRFLDKVKVLIDCKSYLEYGVTKGMIGSIIDAEIRDNCFHVIFTDKNPNIFECKADILAVIKIEDLELVEEWGTTDELIIDALPLHNLEWWCIVEDGYIWNMKGEKKNKIPYRYNS